MTSRDYHHSKAVAWHEASHWAVASELGLKPLSVHADGSGGAVRIAPSETVSSDGRRRMVALYLAGHLGEQMRYGAMPLLTPNSEDYKVVDRLLMALPSQEERVTMQSEAMDLAARALRERWDFVKVLAAELQERGRWSVVA